jgi:hypothetical protein
MQDSSVVQSRSASDVTTTIRHIYGGNYVYMYMLFVDEVEAHTKQVEAIFTCWFGYKCV